ncbi:unnamed protein product [Closterium sp. NIES-53]
MKRMDKPQQQSDWQQPIHLVELFGGIGAGLSAVVRNGIAVRRWTYVEKEPVVRRMAEHHARKLQAEYPELLNERVIREAMGGTTHDVKEISEAEVASWGQVDLLVAGWECQGVSWAGKGKGEGDQRTRLMEEQFRILEWLQERQGRVAYLLENLDLEGDSREPIRLVRDRIRGQLGEGVSCDAARMGSYADRLIMYWQNVVPAMQLQAEIEGVKRAAEWKVQDILAPGRTPAPVCRKSYSRHEQCNQVGQERRALPTLVAYVGAAGYKWEARKPGPGMVYDHGRRRWEEPTALERELAMGYREDATAAPGASEADRLRALGNAMDGHVLRWLVLRMWRETVVSWGQEEEKGGVEAEPRGAWSCHEMGEESGVVGEAMSKEGKDAMQELLARHRKCFAFTMQELGRCKVKEMELKLSSTEPGVDTQPLLPVGAARVLTDTVTAGTIENWVAVSEARARYLRVMMPAALENLHTAQLRDAQRYEQRQKQGAGGRPRKGVSQGQEVYLKRAKQDTLDVGVSTERWRVKEVRPSGVLVLENDKGALLKEHQSNTAMVSGGKPQEKGPVTRAQAARARAQEGAVGK